MIVHITLYGLLRELLPAQARGKTDLEVPEGATLEEVVSRLGVNIMVVTAINGEIERDMSRVLQAEDKVNIFRPAGGG